MAGRSEFDAAQREGEWFHGLRVPTGMWAIVRVDGRGFSKLTTARYEKPYDAAFAGSMSAAATAIVRDFDAALAYSYSDEISIVLSPAHASFGRRVEKLVSIAAGLASATFTHDAGLPVHFDARVWIGAGERAVVDYLSWRQSDAASSSLTNWCYWTLRHAGASAKEATARLSGATVADKNDLLFQHSVNYNDVPAWQRRGVLLRWKPHERAAADPRTGARVTVVRRSLEVEDDLPRGEDFRALVAAELAPDSATPVGP
jgi:tRNA(His) guanylyltransferase